MRTEVYEDVITVGFGKIAYLDGDLTSRTLVVCDIFDRSKSETFENLGFTSESMSVTEAAFTSDGSQWSLTLTYRIDKTAESTWSISRTIGQ